MSDIYRNGGFEPDTWHVLGADESVDGHAAILVPVARFLAERDALVVSGARLGLIVSPGDRLEDVAGDLALFETVAVDFPKFNDGRGFSVARRLVDRYGFGGEIRAFGDVLSDQIPLMRRVGISAFVIEHEPTRRALAEGRLPDVSLFYQPAADHAVSVDAARPWLRRRA